MDMEEFIQRLTQNEGNTLWLPSGMAHVLAEYNYIIHCGAIENVLKDKLVLISVLVSMLIHKINALYI